MNKNPETTAVNLLFYSFIVCMLVFTIFRFTGILWFSQNYVPFESNSILYNVLCIILKTFEGIIILKILTKLKASHCIIISFTYSILIFLIQNHALEFILDVIFTVSIPFICNENKEQSIICSTLYFILICIYQLIMSFSRYNMPAIGKYDLGYALLSTIDYKVFLIIILLFVHRHRINKGGKS